MEAGIFISFVLISIPFIISPGPNVVVIISTSLAAGSRQGLQTVAGIWLAMMIQLFIAAVGTTWLLSVITEGLLWLKWAGVAYLAYLGVVALYHFFTRRGVTVVNATGSFRRGFYVSLTNPKTILFFSAFLPQFVTDATHYAQQISILSVTFLLLALLLDSGYALLAGRMRWLLARKNIDRIQNGLSGALYIVASALLARTSTN
ncbi:MAG: LysE family translocator [Gammaproteobacteria bacterium]